MRKSTHILFAFGLLGIFSLLLGLKLPEELLLTIPKPLALALSLLNPSIILIISIIIGTFLQSKINSKITFDFYSGEKQSIKKKILYSILLGMILGIVLQMIYLYFKEFLPIEMHKTEENQLHIITRVLYGGITEEILMRFGFMSFCIWMISKILSKQKTVYWSSILISSLVFATLHIPYVSVIIEKLDFTVVSYVLLANTLGGILFGYLYWRINLVSAMIAHVSAHIIMYIWEVFILWK